MKPWTFLDSLAEEFFRKRSSFLVLLLFFLAGCSATKNQKSVEWQQFVRRKPLQIWVDAGHGGKDPGACNRPLKIEEKSLCLQTAQFTQRKLLRMGYRARLLRDRDESLSLESRIKKAKTEPKSLLISIHFNSAPNPKAEGLELYYYASQEEPSSTNRLSKELAEQIEKRILKRIPIPSRGIKTASFRILKNLEMPSCLIEGGFLSNSLEAKKLLQKNYLQQLGEGIAEGVDAFYQLQLPLLEKL